MTGLDEFTESAVRDPIESKAQSVTALDVKNMIGGHEDLAGLDDAEYEALVERITDACHSADIDVTITEG